MEEENPTQPELIPCFLCGNPAELKQTKRHKPYFICEPCGVQAFIRGMKGIARLKELVRTGAFSGMADKATALINQMIRLKEKIAELQKRQGPFGFLIEDKELTAAQKALESEIRNIKRQLRSVNRVSPRINS